LKVAVFLAALPAVLVTLPEWYVVEGTSMAPGLLAGDVVRTGWLPVLDRWRRPQRFERWVVQATDGMAIKRVVGLPGERLAIRDGDLVIDDEPVLKGPRMLAEIGSRVAAASGHTGETPGGEAWCASPREVLDDEPAGSARSQVLLPVRDVGLAAAVRVSELPPAGFVRVRARVGSRVVPWRLTATGRHAVVAGRLDGRLVAAAWHTHEQPEVARNCLPENAPEHWQLAANWAESEADGATSPPLGITIEASERESVLEAASLWRDIHYRPAANGLDAWSLGSDECFVLGDHPPSSTDSRQWGAVARHRLQHPIPGVASSAWIGQHEVGVTEHRKTVGTMREAIHHVGRRGVAKPELLDGGLIEIGKQHEPSLAESPGEQPCLQRVGDKRLIPGGDRLVHELLERRPLPPP
jgi:signal peptidase I